MNTIRSMIAIAIAGSAPLAAETSPEINLVFDAELVTDFNIKEPVGMSIDRPIVFDKIKNSNALRFAQSEYIREHYEGYHVVVDIITINPKGHLIQGFGLQQEGEKPVLIFFDVDAVYRNTKKIEDNSIRTRVEELLTERRDK